MKNKFEGLTGGVLIIGSLLWQDHLNEPGDDIRKDWRKGHLNEKEKIKVLIPIRYGRSSGDQTITMVFSHSVRNKPGTGWVVPFLNRKIKTDAQLSAEITSMSTAEGMGGRYISTRGDNSRREAWSTMGLLLSPSKIDAKHKKSLSDWWISQLKADENYRHLISAEYGIGSEPSCLNKHGMLNMPWVKTVDKNMQELLNEYDFLLATVTRPNMPKYPSVQQMADNVKADSRRFYFSNNSKWGITTNQDNRIIKKINSKKKNENAR